MCSLDTLHKLKYHTFSTHSPTFSTHSPTFSTHSPTFSTHSPTFWKFTTLHTKSKWSNVRSILPYASETWRTSKKIRGQRLVPRKNPENTSFLRRYCKIELFLYFYVFTFLSRTTTVVGSRNLIVINCVFAADRNRTKTSSADYKCNVYEAIRYSLKHSVVLAIFCPN